VSREIQEQLNALIAEPHIEDLAKNHGLIDTGVVYRRKAQRCSALVFLCFSRH
jgi:hypothetical protein